MAPALQELFEVAREARSRAHSPYSGFRVGSAIRLATGQIFGGCNVENASYGGTICAERVAITRAVAEVGPIQVVEVLVLTESSPPWPPCGLCRQVIAEFASDCTVHFANESGELISRPFDELFPRGFGPASL